MREILFRVKRQEDGKWVEGFYSRSPKCNTYITTIGAQGCARPEKVDFKTVCQYTGLTDKNGNKIFEGDVVTDNIGNSIGIIQFNKFQWNCKIVKSDYVLSVGCAFPLWQYDNCKENGYRQLEVIGNIFDNPDLLTTSSTNSD